MPLPRTTKPYTNPTNYHCLRCRRGYPAPTWPRRPFRPGAAAEISPQRALKTLNKKATQLDPPFEKNKWRRNNWDKLGSRNTWTLSHKKWSLIHTSLFSETTICWQLRKETWLVYFSWFFSAFLARRGTTFSMSWIVGPATLQWFVMAPWSKVVMPVQCRLKSLKVRAFGMGMVWYQLAWKLGCYSHPNVTTILAACLRCELQGTRVDPCPLGNYSNMSNILRSVKHEDLHRLDVLPRSSPWEIDQVAPSNSLHINGWLWDLWFHISTRLHGSTQKFAERRWFAHPAVSKSQRNFFKFLWNQKFPVCTREWFILRLFFPPAR